MNKVISDRLQNQIIVLALDSHAGPWLNPKFFTEGGRNYDLAFGAYDSKDGVHMAYISITSKIVFYVIGLRKGAGAPTGELRTSSGELLA